VNVLTERMYSFFYVINCLVLSAKNEKRMAQRKPEMFYITFGCYHWNQAQTRTSSVLLASGRCSFTPGVMYGNRSSENTYSSCCINYLHSVRQQTTWRQCGLGIGFLLDQDSIV
jgi:hypothetical protein